MCQGVQGPRSLVSRKKKGLSGGMNGSDRPWCPLVGKGGWSRGKRAHGGQEGCSGQPGCLHRGQAWPGHLRGQGTSCGTGREVAGLGERLGVGEDGLVLADSSSSSQFPAFSWTTDGPQQVTGNRFVPISTPGPGQMTRKLKKGKNLHSCGRHELQSRVFITAGVKPAFPEPVNSPGRRFLPKPGAGASGRDRAASAAASALSWVSGCSGNRNWSETRWESWARPCPPAEDPATSLRPPQRRREPGAGRFRGAGRGLTPTINKRVEALGKAKWQGGTGLRGSGPSFSEGSRFLYAGGGSAAASDGGNRWKTRAEQTLGASGGEEKHPRAKPVAPAGLDPDAEPHCHPAGPGGAAGGAARARRAPSSELTVGVDEAGHPLGWGLFSSAQPSPRSPGAPLSSASPFP